MKEERIMGFVVGQDKAENGRIIWKVRVKQEGHPLNNQRLVVLSVHENVQLATALDVTFLIASIKDDPVAADVKLKLMSFELQQSLQENPLIQTQALNLMVTEVDGDVFVNFTGMESEDEIKRNIDGDEKLVAFFSFEVDGEYDKGALEAIIGLVGVMSEYEESICQQIEQILTVVVNAFFANDRK